MKKLRVLIIALLIVTLAAPASFAAGSRSDNNKGELNTCYIKVDRYYDYAFEMLELINEVRTEEGVRPLKMDKDLLDAAMMRAGESAVFFSHTRPNNTDNDTAIEGVEAENGEKVIYDLTGRRVENITNAGIYIVNGKKVLVK
jgi:uncharacterized protein YkwD